MKAKLKKEASSSQMIQPHATYDARTDLYEHTNGGGCKFDLGYGSYNGHWDSDLTKVWLTSGVLTDMNDKISSITPACNIGVTYLYEHGNGRGEVLVFYQDGSNCNDTFNLTDYKMDPNWWYHYTWNDQVSSAEVVLY